MGRSTDHTLTDQQLRFVDAYLVHLDAGQAATDAGYTSKAYGRQLVSRPHILRAIHSRLRDRQRRIEVDQDYVVHGLVEVVERSMQRRPVMEWDPEERQMRQKTDAEGRDVWEFDGASANKALELLGKHVGMFAKVVEVRGFAKMMEAIASLPADHAAMLLEMDDDELQREIDMLADGRVRRIAAGTED